MIEKFCNYLVNKMREKMPDIDDERAEVINYGLQLVIGEIPKTFIIFGVAFLLGILKLSLISFLAIIPYKTFSGGVHLKTHLGCIVVTTLLYVGNVYLSKYIILEPSFIKYIITGFVWCFSMIMIKLYAPADTENAPILRKKERKVKKILSYIVMTLTLTVSIAIKDNTLSNLFLYGTLLQTLTIIRLTYRMTNNKYGYEEYYKNKEISDITL